MAKVKIQGHASGTGVLTVTAPNTSTDRTITLPDSTGTILDNTSTLDATKLSGNLPAISGANLTGVLPLAGGTVTGTLIANKFQSGDVATNASATLKYNGSNPALELRGGGSATALQIDAGNNSQNYAIKVVDENSGNDVFSVRKDSGAETSNKFDVHMSGVVTNSSGVFNTTPTSTTATGWNFNSGGATVTCTQNTAVKIGDCGASGMLIINDTTLNGQINILLTGAGAFTFLGASSHWVNSSSPSTSQVGFYRSGNQIYVKNGKSSTVQLGLLTFRTRNAQ